MVAAIHGSAAVLVVVLYLVSLVFVIWAVADVARQPPEKMSPASKRKWIVTCIGFWLFFGFVGAGESIFYLAYARRHLKPPLLGGSGT
jgi:hypothetical protein